MTSYGNITFYSSSTVPTPENLFSEVRGRMLFPPGGIHNALRITPMFLKEEADGENKGPLFQEVSITKSSDPYPSQTISGKFKLPFEGDWEQFFIMPMSSNANAQLVQTYRGLVTKEKFQGKMRSVIELTPLVIVPLGEDKKVMIRIHVNKVVEQINTFLGYLRLDIESGKIRLCIPYWPQLQSEEANSV